eukprot:UN4076
MRDFSLNGVSLLAHQSAISPCLPTSHLAWTWASTTASYRPADCSNQNVWWALCTRRRGSTISPVWFEDGAANVLMRRLKPASGSCCSCSRWRSMSL